MRGHSFLAFKVGLFAAVFGAVLVVVSQPLAGFFSLFFEFIYFGVVFVVYGACFAFLLFFGVPAGTFALLDKSGAK